MGRDLEYDEISPWDKYLSRDSRLCNKSLEISRRLPDIPAEDWVGMGAARAKPFRKGSRENHLRKSD